MIRTMIVDDERYSRERLVRLLEKETEFEIVAQAQNGLEALDSLKGKEVDVMFLDVEMPGMTGLELAGKLTEMENPPLVVFATAYDQYALEAFEKNAIDFILKPFQPDRLEKTFARLREKCTRKESGKDPLMALEKYLAANGKKTKRLVGHRRKSTSRIMIDPAEVYYFEVKLGDVLAYTKEEPLIIRSTLQEVYSSLSCEEFVQTHKAYIVNINKIERVEPLFKGDYEIILQNFPDLKIPLSRRYVPDLKRLLGSW